MSRVAEALLRLEAECSATIAWQKGRLQSVSLRPDWQTTIGTTPSNGPLEVPAGVKTLPMPISEPAASAPKPFTPRPIERPGGLPPVTNGARLTPKDLEKLIEPKAPRPPLTTTPVESSISAMAIARIERLPLGKFVLGLLGLGSRAK